MFIEFVSLFRLLNKDYSGCLAIFIRPINVILVKSQQTLTVTDAYEHWFKQIVKPCSMMAANNLVPCVDESFNLPWIAGIGIPQSRCRRVFVSFSNKRVFRVKIQLHRHFADCLAVFVQFWRCRAIAHVINVTPWCLLVGKNLRSP